MLPSWEALSCERPKAIIRIKPPRFASTPRHTLWRTNQLAVGVELPPSLSVCLFFFSSSVQLCCLFSMKTLPETTDLGVPRWSAFSAVFFFFLFCCLCAEQFCAGRECERLVSAWARNRAGGDGWSDALSSPLHDLLRRFLELNGGREKRVRTFGKVKETGRSTRKRRKTEQTKSAWVKCSGVEIATSNKSQMTPIRQRRR